MLNNDHVGIRTDMNATEERKVLLSNPCRDVVRRTVGSWTAARRYKDSVEAQSIVEICLWRDLTSIQASFSADSVLQIGQDIAYLENLLYAKRTARCVN
jgi:hypothetical protein